MAQREGSVYLYLFVGAMVLFLLSTIAFFVKYNDVEKQRAENARLRDQIKAREDNNSQLNQQLNDLHELISGSRDEFAGVNEIRSTALEGVAQAAIKKALVDLGQEADTLQFTYLTEPYQRFEEIFNNYRTVRDQLLSSSDAERTSFLEAKTSNNETVTSLQAQMADLNNQLAQAQQKWEEAEQKGKDEAQRLTEELENVREECADASLDAARKLQAEKNKVSSLTVRLDKLERERRTERTLDDLLPDGRLLDVATELGKGWIDLGRRDHAMTGLIFRVFQPIKGGKKLYKGQVEVRKVDEEISEVRIVSESDPLTHPITAGDYISSPFYDPKEQPVLVFAGSGFQSQDLTEDYLKAKLRSYGVKISDQVDINTTFLVALKNYQDTNEFKNAQNLGVTILRERDLLDFIGN